MATASATIYGALATAGIDAAKVAVLAVLGAAIAYAAAVWGTRKVLQLLGFDVPSGVVEAEDRHLSSSEVTAAEYASEFAVARHEAQNDDSWIDEWSSASGAGDADFHKWRY